ncbi:P-loop containing nucleoside triphosphate hydrolase protein, partial [Chytriomyces sp. MP71]
GHKIKNDKANMSAVVYSIASQYRFILTGTPLQNNLQELWALLHYLYPFIFTPPTAKFFLDSFNLQRGSYNHGCIDSARKLLDLIMLRRLKSTVDLSIPAKEEHIIYLPLTPMQRFWYKRMLTRIDNTMIDDINGGAKSILPNRAGSSFDETKEIMKYAISSGKGDWAKLMNLLLQLRKVCNHPYILPNSEPEPYENGEHLVLASSKLIFLDKFLPKLFADGHRVLIFSQFTKMLDIMEDFMRFRGIAYARLDGRTSRARRNLDIRLFQRKDSPYNVFLISTKAGGLGINLTTADTIIMMDSDWNPQNDLQAMARSHRIGQTKNVKVYRTICQDTVEEQMLTRLQKKLFLSLKVTAGARRQDDGEDSMPTLSKDDLMTIFRYGSRTITSDADDDPEVFLNKSVEDILNASVAHQKSVEALLEGKADAETVKPEFELAGLESVKSRFFEGKNHARKSKTNGDIAKEWMQEEKRTRVQRTVSVGENMVLKELEGCEQWEATPPRGKGNEKEEETPKKRTRKKHDHQELCVVCAEPGMIVMCSGCPRVVHPKCVGSSLKEMERTVLFFCPQHNCCICDRKTQDAGGLLFRCGSCANSYCEDCLPIDEEIREIGDALPEFEALGYGAINQAFYIYCPPCLEHHKKVETSLLDVTPMQHEDTIAKGAGDIGSNSVQEARESGIAVALDAKAAVFHENGHWGEPPKHVLEAITLDSEIVESVDRVPSTLDVMDVHLLGRNGTTALDSVEKEFCTS